ncbi:amino acid permease [Pseudonocardia sp. 73-21]|uniref:amino acid permease n=1 Tax=Pseudonocardia sp. 73-21 TaxID=1895809 RepID=UPI003429ED06
MGGWILMLSFLFAVQDEDKVTGGGGVAVIIGQALDSNGGGVLLLISAAGQFFCTIACMTSTTRMLFAFSRDGAVPGGTYWAKLNASRVPVYGVSS